MDRGSDFGAVAYRAEIVSMVAVPSSTAGAIASPTATDMEVAATKTLSNYGFGRTLSS